MKKVLYDNKKALKTFNSLTPSHQKEIVRYIVKLKSETSVDKNVKRAINHLLGKERFVGREL
ncbi:YdeI/OmpD-associated family protein [Galbibacter sp. EGI 63066]|uniref:YdeI/OmpD-associated family protein n=1 Tax=Galbibacter sp. EGI 63066 TaxID=2993559 RepID=UPI0022496897|nr:YdeI/OmpD-associated family protein [Galbibacter sp. EGI 63066]MCX2682095.1 YdeI/OmpD-associated family protein [Galbibacter sp. EGI 63066]